MNSRPRWTFALLVSFFPIPTFLLAAGAAQSKPLLSATAESKLALREGWALQTSLKVQAKGEAISTAKFAPTGWYHEVMVPTTVVAALGKNKTLPDPFLGMNIRQFPGVTYPIGGNFSNIAMQPDSPYGPSGGDRKRFAAPASLQRGTGWGEREWGKHPAHLSP